MPQVLNSLSTENQQKSSYVLIHDVARKLCLPTYAIKRLMEHVRDIEASNSSKTKAKSYDDDPMPGYMSQRQIAQVEAMLYQLTHDETVPTEKSKMSNKFAALDNMPFLNTLPSQSELYRQLMVSHRGVIN